MNRILNIKGNMVMGLEIHSGASSSGYWAYSLVKQEKKTIKIVRQEYFEGDFSFEKFLEQKFSKKNPIILNFTGVNVLIEETAANDFLKNIPEDELFKKTYNQFTAAIYQKQINQYIEEFYEKGYFIWDIELSSLVISNLLPQVSLNNQVKKIRYTDIGVDFGAGSFYLNDIDDTTSNTISSLQAPCSVANETSSLINLPSLASALYFFMTENEPDNSLIDIYKKECKANMLTYKIIYAFLGFVFAALLLNVLLFQKYNASYTALQSSLNKQKQQKGQIVLLNKALLQKEDILRQVAPSHNIPLSYLADQFALCISDKVRLSKLEIDPIEGKIKEGRIMMFRRGIIRAEGVCDFPEDFANLLKQLAAKTWVSSINKKEYKSTPEGGAFIVEVSYGE